MLSVTDSRFQGVHYSAAKMAIETGNLSIEQLMRLMWKISEYLSTHSVDIDLQFSDYGSFHPIEFSVIHKNGTDYRLSTQHAKRDSAKYEGQSPPFYSEYND
jgi:hypothetical protein